MNRSRVTTNLPSACGRCYVVLAEKDLRARVRRLEELSRLLSIEETLFKDADVTSDMSLHHSDRVEYREGLQEAIRGLGRARMALVDVVQRPGSRQSQDAP